MTVMRTLLHHVELQVLDLDAAIRSFDWLLGELGCIVHRRWADGISWRLGDTYVVVARASLATAHDRRGAGMNHLAFHAGSREAVDRLWSAADAHGWARLYADRHPWAGGEGHYAAFLETAERCKVELVAAPG